MNKIILPFLLLLLALRSGAQVSASPVFPTVDDVVTISYNSNEGNAALALTSPVYAHMGVITDKSQSSTDWKYVKTTWAVTDANSTMQNACMGVWTKTFNIKTFFNIPAGESILKLAFVFRNAAGTLVGRAADGGDLFYDVYPMGAALQTKFLKPTEKSLLVNSGTNIVVQAAASKSGALRLLDNGVQLSTANGTSLVGSVTAGAAGLHTVQFIAETGAEKDTSVFSYFVPFPVVTEDPPAGAQLGITHLNATSIRLMLYAPNKQIVHVIGDFSNWEIASIYQMKRSADGTTWWLHITGLPTDQPVRFQYLVNGTLRIADPLSTLVLDAGNDPFIPAITYPNLPAYPTGKTSGAVSLLYTNPTPFTWQANNYQRPKKTDLVVYELLARDFVARHDFQTIRDSLDYLEKLGVTVMTNTLLKDYDGEKVTLQNGDVIESRLVIWAAGVKGNVPEGINKELIARGNRIKVDNQCRVEGYNNVYAIGDVAYMEQTAWPNGHPQVAPAAMQHADMLANNLRRLEMKSDDTNLQQFFYKDSGSMATVGRNLAVVDIPKPKLHFGGFIAWLIWMGLHLMLILGVKNRFFVFTNWLYNYFTYDQNLRLIFKEFYSHPKVKTSP